MPTFPGFTVTALGLDMQAQAETGKTLTFSRIALGAGAAANPSAATDLVDQRMTSDVQACANMGGGSVRVRAVFSNAALATGFGMSEVGVFALDPTTHVEKLHSYTETATPDYMPPSTGPTLLEQIFDALIAIGSATSVTAAIDDTVMLATKDDTLRRLQTATIGAGGASSVDLPCASAGYDEISIVMQDLFRQACKAYLQADLADGTQESIEIGAASALVGSRSSRAWLSRALASPSVVGTCAGLSNPYGVAVVGNYAYVANSSGNNLKVIDISNPASPSVVGTCAGLSAPYGVAISGSHAYVANSGTTTLSVIDISNPASPSVVGTCAGLSNPYGVDVVGNYAYVANSGGTNLNVIDISNPASPSVVGTCAGLSGPRAIAVVGNYAYVTNTGGNNLKAIDISNPSGGKVTMWRGDSSGMQYEMTMVTPTGSAVLKASGRLPAWATKLTIASLDASGLLAGGSVVVRVRKATPTGVSETAPEDSAMRWQLSVWYNPSTGAVVADMSATGKSVTDWFPVQDVGDLISMTPVWTASGSPIGVLTLEQTNESNPGATTVGDTVDLSAYYTSEFPEPNPDGSAGRKPVLVPAAGARMRWAYTRTSGGAGANCTVYCAEGK